MKCPEIDQIIELALGGESPPGLREHVENCPSCKAEAALLREIPAAFRPGIQVPESLVQRTMETISEARPQPAAVSFSPLHGAVAGFLGMVTLLIALVFTGSIGSAGLTEVLLFSLAVGLGAALNEMRWGVRNGPELS